MKAYGKKTWLLADTYLNSVSKNIQPSHESICVLNTSDEDAELHLTLFFENRDAMDTFYATCGARRTHHVRMDRLRDTNGKAIPRDVPYAVLVESSVPVVVQYTRLDTSHPEMALMTTMGFPVEND